MKLIHRLLTAEELFGILNHDVDEDFVLNLEAAREERAEEILNNNWMGKIGGVNEGE